MGAELSAACDTVPRHTSQSACLALSDALQFVRHLTCILNQVLSSGEGGSRLGPLEQVGVVAALPQLHHYVQQP